MHDHGQSVDADDDLVAGVVERPKCAQLLDFGLADPPRGHAEVGATSGKVAKRGRRTMGVDLHRQPVAGGVAADDQTLEFGLLDDFDAVEAVAGHPAGDQCRRQLLADGVGAVQSEQRLICRRKARKQCEEQAEECSTQAGSMHRDRSFWARPCIVKLQHDAAMANAWRIHGNPVAVLRTQGRSMRSHHLKLTRPISEAAT